MQCHFIRSILGKPRKPSVETLLGRNNRKTMGMYHLHESHKKRQLLLEKLLRAKSPEGKKPDLVVDFCFYNLRWVLVVMFC